MTQHAELIARLEAADHPSYDLQEEFMLACGYVRQRYPMDSDSYWIKPNDTSNPLPEWIDQILISGNAGEALAIRLFGNDVAISTHRDNSGLNAPNRIVSIMPAGRSTYANGSAKTLELAFGAAILRALEAKA